MPGVSTSAHDTAMVLTGTCPQHATGGSVTAGLGIYDAMQLCRSDISTLCFGLAASMGAFLLGAGQKGKRYSMPNSRIMIHQPLGGAGGQAVDMELQVCMPLS